MGTCSSPDEGWKPDLSSFTNKDPYFVVKLENCPECKKQSHYEMNQASFHIDEKRNITHRCCYCNKEWVSRQKYPEQLELW